MNGYLIKIFGQGLNKNLKKKWENFQLKKKILYVLLSRNETIYFRSITSLTFQSNQWYSLRNFIIQIFDHLYNIGYNVKYLHINAFLLLYVSNC